MASYLPHPWRVFNLAAAGPEEAWWDRGGGELQGPAEAPGVQQGPLGLDGGGGGPGGRRGGGPPPAGQTEPLSRPEGLTRQESDRRTERTI
ncbi:PAX3- and PAX7-binding protein 1 [Dissostichus eleginoides]|uniref:PAX3- and PAX7-binding protein 1 n=1 Tax=Dissostichus eleginoides TaxID=100907 RepID=A0AAD9EMM1_DISEL|nr:PAX3- and PAX7-binding protein 1 [Dissostichus eleginoides]